MSNKVDAIVHAFMGFLFLALCVIDVMTVFDDFIYQLLIGLFFLCESLSSYKKHLEEKP